MSWFGMDGDPADQPGPDPRSSMHLTTLSVSSSTEIMITGVRRELGVTPDVLQHLVAVHLGHQHVQQHAVEQLVAKRLERLQPVRHRPHAMAVSLQPGFRSSGGA